MAPTLADGVPGLEGLHTLAPPSAFFPPFVLNDHEDPTTGLTVLPHTRLQRIAGLYDKPNAADPRVDLVNRIGESAFPRQQRGKTLVYTGVVVGRTLAGMRNKLAKLRAAASDGSNDPLHWSLSAAYNATYDPTGLVFTAYGQPVDFTADEVQGSGDASPSPYQRQFVLSYRMADPRWWVTSAPVTGGAGDGVPHVLTMPGTAPSEPTFVVTGSGAGAATILIQHTETGRQLQIALPAALAGGELLTVNYFQRTVVSSINGDMSGYIDWPNSDAFGEAAAASSMLIGTNTLTVTGDPWTCSSLPACW